MKIVEVIIKRLLADFVKDVDSIKDSDSMYLDLELTENDMDTIRERLQLIFNIMIPQDIFLSQATYSEVCSLVYSIYNQGERMSKVTTKHI